MARIRSIHPGQCTDEDFVALSPTARLLAIFLRNFSDDRGAFEWKPLGLKMQIFPADNVDMPALLGELLEQRLVCRYEIDGKPYGAIRNFRKWQRPEKPKYIHPFDDALLSYVGLSSTPPPPIRPRVANQSPTQVVDQSAKVSAEEGGRRKEVGGEKSTTADAVASPPSGGDPPAADRGPSIPLEAAAALWNELCGQALGSVAKLTDLRRKHLRARMVEHWPQDPLGGWRAYCQRIMRSDFLTGRKGSSGAHAGWKADFDWSVNASNAVKVVEGRYDNDRARAPPPPTDGRFVPAPGTV